MAIRTSRHAAGLAVVLAVLVRGACGGPAEVAPGAATPVRPLGTLGPPPGTPAPVLADRGTTLRGRARHDALPPEPREPRLPVIPQAPIPWEAPLPVARASLGRARPPPDPAFSDTSFEGPSRNRWTGARWHDPFHDTWRRPRRAHLHGAARAQVAVEHALRWLAAHQAPDGRWEATPSTRSSDDQHVDAAPGDPGRTPHDVGVTALALCAFRGAGYTSRGRHPYAATVWRGLRFLRSVQDAQGCFGPRTGRAWIYAHAAGSLAMVEAYGVTGSPIFKASAQKALALIALVRTPGAGWRYGLRPGSTDTSVTAWMVAVLYSAARVNRCAIRCGRRSPLAIDEEAFAGARAWIERTTDPDYGRTGYLVRGGPPARYPRHVDRHPPERSESTTASALFVRVALGENLRTSEIGRKGVLLCELHPPRWDPTGGAIDVSYWYWGTLALFRAGGRSWKVWNTALLEALCGNQRLDGTYEGLRGSWDPLGPWGSEGGRV